MLERVPFFKDVNFNLIPVNMFDASLICVNRVIVAMIKTLILNSFGKES